MNPGLRTLGVLALLLASGAVMADDSATPPSSAPAPCQPIRRHGPPASGCPCCAPSIVLSPAPAAAPPPGIPPEITAISTLAIEAAKNNAETVKWVYLAFSGLLSGLAVIAGLFGYRSLKELGEQLRSSFTEKISEAAKRMDQQVQEGGAIIQSLREELARAQGEVGQRIAEQRQLLDIGLRLSADSIEVTRKQLLIATALKGQPAEQRRPMFDEMLPLLGSIEADAQKVGYTRLQTWALSLRAYVHGEMERYQEAIADETRALQLALDLRAQDAAALPIDRVADKYYNLACYHARLGNRTEALGNLRLALDLAPDNARVARGETTAGDFKSLAGDKEFLALLEQAEARLAPAAGG